MVDGAYYRSAGDTTSNSAIILLTDAFGLSLVNPKVLADRLSEKVGVDVWVPDLFNGVSSTKLLLGCLANLLHIHSKQVGLSLRVRTCKDFGLSVLDRR